MDANQAIGFLVAASGNAQLAALRATQALKPSTPITDAQLLMTIASDPDSLYKLAQQVRLMAIMKSLSAFELMHTQFIQTLPNLAAKDAARTYVNLVNSMAALSENGVQVKPPDPFKEIMSKLPPEAQDAINYFIENPDEDDKPAAPLAKSGNSAPPRDPIIIQAPAAPPIERVTSAVAT